MLLFLKDWIEGFSFVTSRPDYYRQLSEEDYCWQNALTNRIHLNRIIAGNPLFSTANQERPDLGYVTSLPL